MVNLIKNSKLSRAASITNKIFSVGLASLMAVSCVPTSAFAASTKHDVDSTSASQKKDNGFSDKMKTAAIFGGTALLAFLGVKGMNYFNSYDRFNFYDDLDSYDSVIDLYLRSEPTRNVSFDEWFTRLGGSDADIANYNPERPANLTARQRASLSTIDVDVPRDVSTVVGFSKDERQNFEILMKEILETWVYAGHEYTQGCDRFAVVTINKFLQSGKQNWDATDKAKMYYVFKTIVQTSYAKCLEKDSTSGPCEKFAHITEETLREKPLRRFSYTLPSKDDSIQTLEDLAGACLVSPYITQGADMFTTAQYLNLWDTVILNDDIVSGGDFDVERARRFFNVVINAVALKIDNESLYFERCGKIRLSMIQSGLKMFCAKREREEFWYKDYSTLFAED